uniref:uncharacterized protein LOC120326874 n=1 Tax=Styela clava TaxID=7725 RepID=UPI001939B8B0|nr:uncharacterized protein LOC120326874 [Styela clava]
MKPSEIRFSQDDIAPNFTNGENIHEVIGEILRGETSVYPFQPISVWYENGSWYSENNRRLYMFRVLEYEGKVNDICVEETSPPGWRPNTSDNDGVSIRLRGGVKTYHHSIEDIYKAARGRTQSVYQSPGSRGDHRRGQDVATSDQGSGWGSALMTGGALLAGAAAVMAASSASNRENNQNDRRRQQQQPENPRNEECAIQ